MFTGIIERIGQVKSVSNRGSGVSLDLDTGPGPFELSPGDSVAVDGLCLTAVQVIEKGFTCEASRESLQRSTISLARPGTRVNLERSLRVGDRLGGHLVSGHVDAMGRISEARPERGFASITVAAPPEVMGLVVEKGSIALDGISLTVNNVLADRFSIMVIPETLARTTLGAKKPGQEVNLETDVIGKYVAKLLGRAGSNRDQGGLARKLIEQGFM